MAVLASVNIASRFALKEFVEDQLGRLNWDISAYQSGDVQAIPEVSKALRDTDGITGHSNLLFLRNTMTAEDVAYIDGRPIRMPWLTLLTTSDPDSLPLGIRPVDGKAVLVLVGTKSRMGDAYAQLQNRRRLEIRVEDRHVEGEHHADGHGDHAGIEAFALDLDRTIRIERKDLNRWFLEQTSSPALIPEIGVILVTPYDPELWSAFDRLARGIVSLHQHEDIHEEAGSYFPDIMHLLRIDTERLVSGWDLDRSLQNLEALQARLDENTFAIGPRVFVDNSIRILLQRMRDTAERVGLLSLLVALPLIWVGWVLMANLSGMLLLNERRRFGLLRLRGASGRAMGRALQLSIAAGALLGGSLGAVTGTLLPISIYEGGLLPLETILTVQRPAILITYILIGLVVALAVSRRLVRYAATISPLEASGRVVESESRQANVHFGTLACLALVVGSYKILAWIAGVSLVALSAPGWLIRVDRILDFAGFPLFVYGLVTFVVSRRGLMNRLLQMMIAVIGGPLRGKALRHVATRPQRVAGFLLIVAMMTTIGLYPTVMTAVFDNKIARATRVQVGSDMQLTLNASDIVSNDLLAGGGINEQYLALQEATPAIVDALRNVPGVHAADWTLFKAVSDGVYMPGYGFNGLPLYLLPDKDRYLEAVYHEASLARQAAFADMIGQLSRGSVLLSPAVAEFTGKGPGDTTQLGRDGGGAGMIESTVAGTVWYLPGSPLVSVTDRESFDSARVDYVNHLFSNNAYMVADPNRTAIGDLDVLITDVQFAVSLAPGADPDAVRAAIHETLAVEPSNIRTYAEEIRKIGSDMYVFLARENVRIYLTGGLLLAVIGILSVAHTNYLEDRRTLALLRIRGAGPKAVLRFFGAGIFAPSLLGLLIGVVVSLIVGYGMTNLVWELREVKNILLYLDTRLAISGLTVLITLMLLLVIILIGVVFSHWAFRKTVREGLGDH